jgi:hypothetical protein
MSGNPNALVVMFLARLCYKSTMMSALLGVMRPLGTARDKPHGGFE